MAYFTDFAVKEKYNYLIGFGNYHTSEGLPGANTAVNNSPQRPPLGLRTERISGSAFTAPRSKNFQTWMYRASSSLIHSEFLPYKAAPAPPIHMSPNDYLWPAFPVKEGADWTEQKLLARNGDPTTKHGVAIWVFAITKDMKECTAISSLDGDLLIVLQSGALDIQTELGRILVRQNEIAVIPRGIRHRVTLATPLARGFVLELFQGHWELPALGAIGSTGLANVRDFQIPEAFFDGRVTNGMARANDAEWTIISRMNGQLWTCSQNHTPFDVAAWHGTFYPYKYDLAKFCHLGNAVYDEHDPSLFVVLSASVGDNPGAAAAEFAILSPRWQVSDSLWLPYYHRNTHTEFYAPIINKQDPDLGFNKGIAFKPFAAGMKGLMTTHGAKEDDYKQASDQDLSPAIVMNDGISIFLVETEKPLFLSDWASEAALKNFDSQPRPKI